MTTAYFCPYHAERMQAFEQEALRCWMEMMRRGMQAYLSCRHEAADIYLSAALDIGLLRQENSINAIFSDTHITKAADFLIELFCSTLQFDHAITTLAKISTLIDRTQCQFNMHFLDWLATQYAKVKTAEKTYLIEQYGVKELLASSAQLTTQ